MTESDIYIHEDWVGSLKAAGLGDYEKLMTADVGVKLIKPGLGTRQRIRIDDFPSPTGEKVIVFLKRYGHAGPEKIERDAIELVASVGIRTMKIIACGSGSHGGFIMVTRVAGEPLSDCFDALEAKLGADSELLNARLADGLADIAARLHAASLVHKDFYATHIFIDADGDTDELSISLIDLARVEEVKFRKWKWFVKDLSGLHFSMPRAWVSRNWQRFMDSYADKRGTKIPFWVHWWILWRSSRTQKSFGRRIRRQKSSAGDSR